MSEKMSGTLATNFTDPVHARFEAEWEARHSGDPLPCWRDYLPAPEVPCTAELVFMLLKLDIEHRVKAGLPALLAERYFEHPRLQQADAQLDAERQVELIRWEYEQRWLRGQQARREDYETAFPQHTNVIREFKPYSRCPKCQKAVALEDTNQTFACPVCDSASASFSISAAVPTDLDLRGYELTETLGKGGMGEVYRCCDPALGRNLAIKVMKEEYQTQPAVERRFIREARITGSLQHPGIVAVYNLGRLPDGRLHYTMRLVRGRTLAEILKEDAGKPERLPALLAIFQKVCEAVAYAHSKHVIHRDLKPMNIMVGKFGEVQVMDWGLAKLLTAEAEPVDEEPRLEAGGTLIHTETTDMPSDLTRSGSGIGTPAYMSPEQAQGDWELVDERVDVFALGAILCLMLTGRPPYSGEDGNEVLRRARYGDLADAQARLEQCGADAALTNLCRECLAVDRRQRPRHAGVVAQRVAEYQIEVEARLRKAELERTEAQIKSWAERKRRRLALMLSSAVLLVLAAGIVISSLFALEADRAKRRADGNARWAEEQRQLAETQRVEAEEQRQQAETNAAEARRQGERVKENLKKRMDIIDNFLFRMDGRLDKAGAPSSVRQEFLHDAIQLSEGVLKEQPNDPSSRRQTARLYSSSGELWRSMESFPEAEAALRKALDLQKKLAAEFADNADYKKELALTYAQQARLLRDLRRFTDARRGYEEAIRLEDELAQRFPKDSGYRQRGALNRFRRADLLEESGQKQLAEEGYRDALRRQEQLVSDWPQKPAFHADLAVTAASLAALLAQKEAAAGLPYLEQSVRARRQAFQLARHVTQYKSDLLDCYTDLVELQSKCGKHEEVARLAEAYRADFPDDSDETYNAACFMAWACRTARDGKDVPQNERRKLADLYGARAVKMLDMAIHEGYRDRVHMDWDTDLDPLRDRKDYQELMANLERRFPAPQTPTQEYEALQKEFQNAYDVHLARQQQATTVAEKKKAQAKQPRFEEFAERFFQLAEKHRGSGTAVEALLWVLNKTGEQAAAQAPLRRRALDVLQRDYLQKPELALVCRTLSEEPAPDCDELLRVALAKHAQSDVRGLAGYALAQSLANQAGQAQQSNPAKAEELYRAAEKQLEEVIQKYGSVPTGKSSLGEAAKAKLHAVRHLSVGRQALEIEGRDLDGKPFKLSDFRGKVVVLDFWADWCGYCRQMYSREREMVAQMKDRPFVLLGVNCDDDPALARRAVEKDKLNWRSWWNGGRSGERINTQWQVHAFPTVYVLDGKGVIRYKLEGVPDASLEKAVEQLLQEMAK